MSDRMSFRVRNLDAVTRNISRLLVDSLENGVALQRKIAVEVLSRVATLTPVDTGRATANWRAKLNSAEDRVFPFSFDRGMIPTTTINRGREVLNNAKVGDTMYISNSVQGNASEGGYILKLENGASPQAPHGMVRIAVDTTIVSNLS